MKILLGLGNFPRMEGGKRVGVGGRPAVCVFVCVCVPLQKMRFLWTGDIWSKRRLNIHMDKLKKMKKGKES